MDSQNPGPSQPKQSKTKAGKTMDNRPFIPECEVLYEGGPDSQQLFDGCTKNPGHGKFIPVNELTMDHLPQECRSDKYMNAIQQCCDRTVKLIVKYTSINRPSTYPNSTAPYPYSERCYKGNNRAVRCGTGVIYYIRPSRIKGKPCPCHLCKESGTPQLEFVKVEVFTAAHVVFDDSEAECTTCEVFYDSKDRTNVRCLYGVKGVKNGSGGYCPEHDDVIASVTERCTGDKFFIQCVTHDMELFEILLSKMSGIYSQYYGLSPLKFIISHPHGCSKHISFGSVHYYTVPIPAGHSPASPYIISKGVVCKTASVPLAFSEHTGLFEKVRTDFTGREIFKLRKNLKLYLPTDAPFLCQCDVEHCDVNAKVDWMKFPDNAKFTNMSGKKSFFLPNVQFFLPELVDILDGKFLSFFMAYDMATCVGSSGAQVVADNVYLYELDWATHFGGLLNGANRSGINKHFLNHMTPRSDEVTCSMM